MSCRALACVLCLASCVDLGQVSAQDLPVDPATVEFFETKIRPLFVENCHSCHGSQMQKGGLRLDSRLAVLSGGDSGPALLPNHPDESRLIQAVRYSDGLQMPPKNKLSSAQVEALTAWVKAGAVWPESNTAMRSASADSFQITEKDRQFWSFRPILAPAIPEVIDVAWPNSPLDRFILAKLETQNLRPVAPADKRTLLRRVNFDLIGLPPTPEETQAFLADDSPEAFAKVVDRLLASPHYGERWARHWLDVARYGEDQAHTFEARKYPDGFRYRDWVVHALNADMPYDRFLMEQIAGDLLEDGNRADRLAALGFFALGPVYYGKAIADELDDRIDTLCRGLLGLTVACARCHDHKFDPIPSRDYYALAGIFSSTDYKEYVLTADGRIDDTATQLPTDKKKDAKDKNEPRKPVVHAVTEGAKPANARINLRGNPANLGDEAPRRFLEILAGPSPAEFTQGSGRLELARAIVDRQNPLTARVIVNRVWMHHFGRGIVGTPSNFGSLGERPTHPELLDYLASRLMEENWSLKALHRQILLSATYQLSSQHDPANAKLDPDNRLLWRINRRRLEVEPWRDAMLAVAGNLDRTIGGPSVDLSSQQNLRRTLYAAVSRHNLDPALRLFDFPDPNLTSDQRPVTSVPLQQLFVLNSEFMARQSQTLAIRLTSGTPSDNSARITRAYELVFSRSPSELELQLGLAFLKSASGETEAADSAAAWEKYAQVLLSSNEFAFVD